MVTGGCCCLKYILAVKGTGGIGVGGRSRRIEGDGCWGREWGGEEGESWTQRQVREEMVQQAQRGWPGHISCCLKESRCGV